MSNLILPPDLEDEEIVRIKAEWEELIKHPPYVPYDNHILYVCFNLTHAHRYRWVAGVCGWSQYLWAKLWRKGEP